MLAIDVVVAREHIQVNYPNDPLLKAIAGSLLEALPKIDATEVVHGHWIPRIDNDTPMHECSVCGARVVKGLYEYENPNNYCYHCGAKMDDDCPTQGNDNKTKEENRQ